MLIFVLLTLTLLDTFLASSSTVTIPKCCPLAQALNDKDTTTCEFLGNGTADWKPDYWDNVFVSTESSLASKAKASPNIEVVRLEECPEPQILIRTFPFQLNRLPKTGFLLYDQDADIRFLSDGQILTRLSGHRSWEVVTGNFCVDGLIQMKASSGHQKPGSVILGGHFVLKTCRDPQTALFRSPDVESAPMYMILGMLLHAISPLLHVLVYGLLWTEQNVHGWTVVMVSLSLVFVYTTFVIGWLLSLSRTWQRTPLCIGLTMTSHFFGMSYYVWLLLMNFDVWITLRSMTPKSERSKGYKRFGHYCLVGLGVPGLMVTFSLAMDLTFDPFDPRAIRPEYGQVACSYVDGSNMFLYYQTLPQCVLQVTALIFGLMAARIVRGGPKMNLTSTKNKAQLSEAKRVGKLFVLTGTSWTLTSLFRIVDRPLNWDTYPVYYVLRAIVFVYNALQPWIIFYIFVWRKEIKDQLEEKYHFFKRSFSKIERFYKSAFVHPDEQNAKEVPK